MAWCILIAASATNLHGQDSTLANTTTPLNFTPLDAIVAVVGDGILLESEVEAQAFALKAQLAQQGKSANELNALQRCNLLNELLFQKLLVHHAKLDSLEVSDGEIMDEIDRRLAYYIRMFGSVEAFEAEYGQSVSEWKAEFEDPVREQLLAGRMQGQINQQVRATPAEVQQLFSSTPTDSLPLIPEALRYRELMMQPSITEAQKAGSSKQPGLDSNSSLHGTTQHDTGRFPPLGRPGLQIQRRLL